MRRASIIIKFVITAALWVWLWLAVGVWAALDYLFAEMPRVVGECSVQCEPYKPAVSLSLECYCDTTRTIPEALP